MEIFLSPDGWLLLLKGAFAGILGFCGGAIVAGGYIALVVKVGIITRMSARTKTASYSRWYEDMLVCGAVLGSLYSVFHWKLPGKWLFLVPYGFFAGIFTGCLAIALAEIVNAFPIFSRRIRLKQGLSWILIALALGKLMGSLLQLVFLT